MGFALIDGFGKGTEWRVQGEGFGRNLAVVEEVHVVPFALGVLVAHFVGDGVGEWDVGKRSQRKDAKAQRSAMEACRSRDWRGPETTPQRVSSLSIVDSAQFTYRHRCAQSPTSLDSLVEYTECTPARIQDF